MDRSLDLEDLLVDSFVALTPVACPVMVADLMGSCYLQMVAQLDVEPLTELRRLEGLPRAE